MKELLFAGLLLAGATACNNTQPEKPESSETSSQPAKEESKTSISLSPDSVGVTTKDGDKVEVNSDGSKMEGEKTKIEVKKGDGQ